MEIAIIADDAKKELLTQFCIAYCGILSKHNICSTSVTGRLVADATGLEIERLLAGKQGGVQQIASRVQYNEIDVVLYFRSSETTPTFYEEEYQLLRMCDLHNIPVATNIATAEVIICALDKGDLDWREIVNPRSEYNRRRKQSI
ncbi:MAG: methylglyoxal synthase [Ruminococcaceae bacterium]|nr:methylglyoxal synthase [Oscillospiraceae bacterium]